MENLPVPWSPPEELPDHPYRFVPVPRRTGRRDGWSADRQHAFVWALATLPSVAAAARSVGMTARSAYRLRAAPGADAFAAAWDDALEIGMQRARDDAIHRLANGFDRPRYYRGRIVGQERRYNDGLLSRVLANMRASQEGMVAHQQRIAYRRAVREADRRLGGPVDWDAHDRAFIEAQQQREAEDAAWLAERRAARRARLDAENYPTYDRHGNRGLYRT